MINLVRRFLGLALLIVFTLSIPSMAYGRSPENAWKEHLTKLKELYEFKSMGEDHPLYAGFTLNLDDTVGKFKVKRVRSSRGGGVDYLLRPTRRIGGENCLVRVRTFPSISEAEDATIPALSSYELTASAGSLYGEKIGDHTFSSRVSNSIALHCKNIKLAIYARGVSKVYVEELAKELVERVDKLPQVPREKGIKQPVICRFAPVGTITKVGEPVEIEIEVDWDGHYFCDFITDGTVRLSAHKYFFSAPKPGIYEVTCIVTTATGLVVESEKTQVCVIKVAEQAQGNSGNSGDIIPI